MNLADDLVGRLRGLMETFEGIHQGLADMYRQPLAEEGRIVLTDLRLRFCEAVTETRNLKAMCELMDAPPPMIMVLPPERAVAALRSRIVPDLKMRQAGDHSLDPDEPKS